MQTRSIFLAALIATSAQARAEEPRGCDKFKWPIAGIQAALQSAGAAVGSELSVPVGEAVKAQLVPFASARFALAPERSPKNPSSYAGVFAVTAPPAPAAYVVSLSGEGWIDVVQDGHFIKSVAFTGALDCPGVRKSVKFMLEAKPFTLQVSNVSVPQLSVLVAAEPTP